MSPDTALTRPQPDSFLDCYNNWLTEAAGYEALGQLEKGVLLRQCGADLFRAMAAAIDQFPQRDALEMLAGNLLSEGELKQCLSASPLVAAAGAAQVACMTAVLDCLQSGHLPDHVVGDPAATTLALARERDARATGPSPADVAKARAVARNAKDAA